MRFADHEREVAELQAHFDECRSVGNDMIEQHEAEITRLRAELDAKSKDAARWRYARTILAIEHIESAYELCGHPSHVPNEEENARADQAIDIAMGEGNAQDA